MYLLLENNHAIACYTKALESRNGKCFRRVTEEGYYSFSLGVLLYETLRERLERVFSLGVSLSLWEKGRRFSATSVNRRAVPLIIKLCRLG
ncbi:hypothetical protein FM036_09185 [Nostoc sp. HG1]|nr:hypothetical protein [Nostoc sp. HG1]